MAPKNPKIAPKKSTSVLKRPLKFDLKELGGALAKGIGHLVLGKFDDLVDDGAEALSAIGLEGKTPQELLFLLLERSLTRALNALLRDSHDHLPEDMDTDLLMGCLEEAITVAEVDSSFFSNPVQLPLLNGVSLALQSWLEKSGARSAIAETLAQRLPGFFPYALHMEWQSNAKHYETIRAHFDSPFAPAAEREAAWEAYAAQLQQRLDESVFDEPFGLRQIYIPLNAYYEEDDSKASRSDGPARKKRRVAVKLMEELQGWLDRNDSMEAVRVVSGGPGSGKSSFAKMFAAAVAAQGRLKVLFVPLHLINPKEDFGDEIGRFVRDEGILKGNPLDAETGEVNLLVILDGLDELASQGKAAAATARDFVRAVQQTVDRRNLRELRLRILFSGREVVVHESESEFRRPRQVLTVLPYLAEHHEDAAPPREAEETVDDPKRLLEQDLRQAWWENYGRLTGRDFQGLPAELNRQDLQEITAQPLLNYLLAISYCGGNLDFSREVTLNTIYASLVQDVYERGYEKSGKPHIAVRQMSLEDFKRVLEEIGLAAWHGDGRSTTVGEIEEHCAKSGLRRLLEVFEDGAKQGVTRLLAAFFFRRHGQRERSGDATFVFTHKSFGEYLTACRLVRGMERIATQLERREGSPDDGWDDKEALVYWVQLCGPTAMTAYLHKFFVAEVALRDKAHLRQWQTHFTRLFSHLLRHGMPMEKLQLPTFQDALFQSRNAEEALLAALNACARVTGQVSQIEHSSTTSFGAWFKRIQGQRSGPDSVLTASCMSWLNLSISILHLCDLYGANLSDSKLTKIECTWGILAMANLRRSDLEGAKLEEANLKGAKLEGANLEGANLEGANLEGANLEGADLEGANLKGANLKGANLKGANLKRANLRRTILEGANLEEANLNRATSKNRVRKAGKV